MAMKRKHFLAGAFVLCILLVIVATQVHLIYVDPEIKAQKAAELMLSNLETATCSEQPDRSFVAKQVPFEAIVKVVEEAKAEPWSDFHGRYGDWGTAMVLHLARRHTGLTLRPYV